VEIARTNKDWEVEYMGWMADRQDAYNEGHTEGLEQGAKAYVLPIKRTGRSLRFLPVLFRLLL